MKLKTIPSWIDLLQGVVLWNFRAHKSKIKIKKTKQIKKIVIYPAGLWNLLVFYFHRWKVGQVFKKRKKKKWKWCVDHLHKKPQRNTHTQKETQKTKQKPNNNKKSQNTGICITAILGMVIERKFCKFGWGINSHALKKPLQHTQTQPPTKKSKQLELNSTFFLGTGIVLPSRENKCLPSHTVLLAGFKCYVVKEDKEKFKKLGF